MPKPNAAITHLAPSVIVVPKDYPRRSYGAFDGLLDMVRHDGILTPLWIDQKNQLIHGLGRLRCAQELGLETIPCVIWEDER